MVIKERNPILWAILSYCCCFFPSFIWGWKVAKESAYLNNSEDNGFIEAILSIICPPAGIFLASKKLTTGLNAHGIAAEDNSLIYLILSLFGLSPIALFLMQKELNKVATSQI